ncbi:MAG: gephyrin-like molybdotransferase Glp [bacterium]
MGTDHAHCHDEDVDKLSVDEALEQVRTVSVDLKEETVSVTDSQGRILSEPVDVREDLPRFDQSAMDGYAVRSEDLKDASKDNPVTLPCEKDVAAGQLDLPAVETNETARIFTGAPVPDGADAVVIQENVERNGDAVTFFNPVEAGANIRNKGEEVQSGTRLINEGDYLNTGALGLLLSQGYETVRTYRAPDVGIAATGDELIDPSETPAPGQKRDTNSFLVKNIMREYTGSTDVRRLADDRESVKAGLSNLIDENDLLIISGGVSVGDRDFVRPVLDELGVREIFWKVNQKPGKPLYLGETKGTKVLGLPGNPVSACVCLLVYGIPLIRKMMGYPQEMLELQRGVTRLRNERHNPKDRTEFVRARTTETPNGYRSEILPNQGSHMLSGLARANSLVVIPAERNDITPDKEIPCLFLTDSSLSRELTTP